MSREKLTLDAIRTQLAELSGWSVAGDKLHREYQFRDFPQAFGFMTTAALYIQSMDHHPEWTNVYNRVRVDLSTHDAGGITARDVELAKKLEEIAGRFRR